LRKLTAALALVCALTFAGTAAAVDFGANDDTGKYAGDGGATFFSQMAATGLKQNVMTVRWTPGSSAIPDKAFLDRAVPTAVARGIKPIFAVYPYPPSVIEAGGADPAAFAAWLGGLAAAYPQVTTFIVGNEPNLNTFWRPQGNGAGQILSGASFGPFLAAGYDALKAASPGSTVLGVGLSPRGDDNPGSAGKTSPVHFLHALGEWYRSSNRMTPLMDGFSFHPYPNPSDFTVPFSFAYGWPNASVQELDRIKQALWDAFEGTGQPTTASGLKLYLDEVGWQVATDAGRGYTGSENVKVTSEETQAAIYADLVRHVACDPDVAQLNFFGYYDERILEGWQSALRRVDGSERASNASVAAAIAESGCRGAQSSWSPARQVLGAAAEFGDAGKSAPAKRRAWNFTATALEDATYTAGIFAAGTSTSEIGRGLASTRAAIVTATGTIKARFKPRVTFAPTTLPEGSYVYAIRMAAWANADRETVLVSRPFVVGSGGASGGKGTTGLGVTVTRGLELIVAGAKALTVSLDRLKSVGKPLPPVSCALACTVTATLKSTTSPKAFSATKKLKKGQKARLKLKLKGAKAGTYRLTLKVVAGAKSGSITSKPFVMAATGAIQKAKDTAKPTKGKAKPKGKSKPKPKGKR
jgi:hypothetical protein